MNGKAQHAAGLFGLGVSIVGAIEPSTLAAYAGTFCGLCTGLFYAAKTAVFIRHEYQRRTQADDLSE